MIFFVVVNVSGAPKPRRSGAGGAIVGFYVKFCLSDPSDSTGPIISSSRNQSKLDTLAALRSKGPEV